MNKENRSKIFLMGGINRNTGPANVNRNLITADRSIWYQKSRKRLVRFLETAIKFLLSDTIVFSAYVRVFAVRLAKLLKKKTVYLMHGYIKYENEINQLNVPEEILKEEDAVFANRVRTGLLITLGVYMVLSGSVFVFAEQLLRMMAADFRILEASVSISERLPNTIAVAGADRLIKNNDEVCKAVEKLQQTGKKKLTLYVFGKMNHNESNLFEKYSCCIYRGLLSNEDFLEELKKIQLFVVNSTIESFGLVVGEALSCGCSLLISENVGFCDLLDLTEADVIHDVHDVNEISEKMMYLLKNPNNRRLAASVNWEHYSKKNVALRLHQICDKLLAGEDYSKIR